jgi:hypothetical protein
LDGTVTAGHIHYGKKGESGGVALDLAPFTNNGSYKYSPFNNAISLAMRRNDSTYVNIHSTAFANGEVRGQLMRYYRISSETMDTTNSNPTGLTENSYVNNQPQLFPNPVNNVFTISIDSKVAGNAKVVVYDLTGKEVASVAYFILRGSNSMKVDASGLQQGIYFTTISINGNTISTQKLIKQ